MYKFFSCYYYCNDNPSSGYHKTFRIRSNEIQNKRIQDKYKYKINIDLVKETKIIVDINDETISIQRNSMLEALSDTLEREMGKPITFINCILFNTQKEVDDDKVNHKFL